MTEINLKPIFDHMDEMEGRLKSEISEVKESVKLLQTSVDSLAKMVKDFRDEHVIIHKRLEILEEWAKQVSKKLGISLPF